MKLPAFIFSNKLFYRFLRHFAFWAGRSVFAFFFALNSRYSPSKDIFDIFKSIIQFIPIILSVEIPYCYLVVYAIGPRYFLTKKYKIFCFLFFIISLIFLIYSDLLLYRYHKVPSEQKYLFIWNNTITFLISGPPAVCITFLSLKFFKTWYLKQEEKQMLVKANADAEIKLLKAQVHPHFLFNTLNNIYSFILAKSPQAKIMVKELSSMLHYIIEECEQPLVLLSKEINMINNYIDLEKVRYGNNLNIEMKITIDTNKVIAPLLMIPFIENSFKHGTSKMLANPWIKLNIEVKESTLYFSLANSKPDAEINANNKKGIGLNNVKKRLELLYSEKHYLQIEATKDTFIVEMQIPAEENKLIKGNVIIEEAVSAFA